MRSKLSVLVIAVISVGTIGPFTGSSAATDTIPYKWKNCKIVNMRYPHGVGRWGARDRTSGIPVTNFKRSTRLYTIAMSYNRGLDRDKDGIACEKR